MKTDVEIAWAAGLFEGEGCLTIDRGRHPRALLMSTDEDVLIRFQEIVGGVLYGPYQRSERHKPIYTWALNRSGEVIRFIRLFSPLLGRRRRARAEEVKTAAWRVVGDMFLSAATNDSAGDFVVPASAFVQLRAALGEE